MMDRRPSRVFSHVDRFEQRTMDKKRPGHSLSFLVLALHTLSQVKVKVAV